MLLLPLPPSQSHLNPTPGMAKNNAKLQVGDQAHDLAGTVTIGRKDDNMIVLDDESVSSHHTEIVVRDDLVLLRDLGSTNGTKVNGQPVTENELKTGDVIRFGSVETRLYIEAVPHCAASCETKTLNERLVSAGRLAAAGIKSAAVVARKQAERQKLGIFDLRTADINTGKRAYEERALVEPFQAIHKDIASVNAEIETKSQKHSLDPGSSMREKAKQAALMLKDRGLLEAAYIKRNQLFQTLGAKIREEHSDVVALQSEIQGAAAIVNKQRILSEEIDGINKQAHPAARIPWLVVGVSVLLLFLGVSYSFRGAKASPADAQKVLADVASAVHEEIPASVSGQDSGKVDVEKTRRTWTKIHEIMAAVENLIVANSSAMEQGKPYLTTEALSKQFVTVYAVINAMNKDGIDGDLADFMTYLYRTAPPILLKMARLQNADPDTYAAELEGAIKAMSTMSQNGVKMGELLNTRYGGGFEPWEVGNN